MYINPSKVLNATDISNILSNYTPAESYDEFRGRVLESPNFVKHLISKKYINDLYLLIFYTKFLYIQAPTNQREYHIRHNNLHVVSCPHCDNPKLWNYDDKKYYKTCGEKSV